MRPAKAYLSALAAQVVGSQTHHSVLASSNDIGWDNAPPPPEPEEIIVTRIPLPPVAPSSDVGACTLEINPRGTGCIAATSDLQTGSFLPDNIHVLAIANFTGAPAAPHPASIYDGQQVILLKTDDEMFPNGDSWKCITCGVSAERSVGRGESLDYPQAFQDGKRLLAGFNIIDCPDGLVSESCNSDTVRIVPLHWDTGDNSGPGGNMRELRLHNDNVHIGFNTFFYSSAGMGQYALMGRITYNPNPTTGVPLAARYDVNNTYVFGNGTNAAYLIVDPNNSSQLTFNPQAYTVGELRGFSGPGDEVTYLGAPVESCNFDVFGANLRTGGIRRLTAHPEYVDPVAISPDGQWTVVMDTRGTDRQMFLAGLRGVPPLTDVVAAGVTASTRNNGKRRFFNVILIDYFGDRGSYFGQKINDAGSGIPGSGDINDPEWNGRADPRFSWDGTKIVYTQAQTVSPACGGRNPLPCYNSTEDGGRTERAMLASLVTREPKPFSGVSPIPDEVPWGTPGSSFPNAPTLAPGNYTLRGRHSGWADVYLGPQGAGSLVISEVAVVYHDFSDDGVNVLVGSESVSRTSITATESVLDWYSNLTQTGPNNGTKMTGPGGFQLRMNVEENIFIANGTLVTVVNGKEYLQPANMT